MFGVYFVGQFWSSIGQYLVVQVRVISNLLFIQKLERFVFLLGFNLLERFRCKSILVCCYKLEDFREKVGYEVGKKDVFFSSEAGEYFG